MSEAEERRQRARQRRIDTGRELEGRGFVDHAVREYVRAKAPEEAGRALLAVGRAGDAARAMLECLGVEPGGVGSLGAAEREHARQAAELFQQSGDVTTAQGILAALASAPPPPSERPPAGQSAALPGRVASPAQAVPSASPAASGEAPRPRAMSSGGFRPPLQGGSFRPPASTESGSFRPPTSSSGSFRAPSGESGSFRPPSGGAGSLRAPSPAGSASSSSSGSFRAPKPGSSGSLQPPSAGRSAPPTPPPVAASPVAASPVAASPVAASPVAASPVASSPVASSPGASSPGASSPAIRSRATSEPRLSASGDVVTEYSGSREAGWRDASSESIDESIRQMVESGRKGAAARIAWDAGRHEQALAWFRELSLHFQAGACLRALGRMDEALEALLRVPLDGPHYRRACFELVPVAKALGRIEFDIDRFFTRFVDEGPREPDEIPTFLELAQVYRQAEFLRGAVRCVAKVLALEPTHAVALALRSELEGRPAPSVRPQPRAAVAERGLPPLPTLQELVELARAHVPPRPPQS